MGQSIPAGREHRDTGTSCVLGDADESLGTFRHLHWDVWLLRLSADLHTEQLLPIWAQWPH